MKVNRQTPTADTHHSSQLIPLALTLLQVHFVVCIFPPSSPLFKYLPKLTSLPTFSVFPSLLTLSVSYSRPVNSNYEVSR